MPRSQHAKGKVRMIGSRNSFESQSLNIGESIPGAIWLATVLAIYSVIDIEQNKWPKSVQLLAEWIEMRICVVAKFLKKKKF